jgi:hypothetical protein
MYFQPKLDDSASKLHGFLSLNYPLVQECFLVAHLLETSARIRL